MVTEAYETIGISEELSVTSAMIRDYCQRDLLTHDEEKRLAQQVRQGGEIGKQAEQEMLFSNIRLVVDTAKKFQERGLDLSDLIQEGIFGLMKAIQKFDPDRGFKFSTYATWWVRQRITRAIFDYGTCVRVPVHMHERIRRVSNAWYETAQGNGGFPSRQELVAATKLDSNQIQLALDAGRMQQPLSLETPIGEEDDTLAECIEDKNASWPEDEAFSNILTEKLDELVNTLQGKELTVIKMRYYQDRTLWECGKELGITRERVRQIQLSAVEKLKARAKRMRLEEYL